MRPESRDLGGHEQFHFYKKWFEEMYRDEERPIFDVLGRRVLFGMEPFLDDCAHVCYGGTKGHAYVKEYWYQDRAVRLAWIERTLTDPTRIHPDEDIPKRHKYLLYLPLDDETQDYEFFCVIVRVMDSKTVAFLTAYNISRDTFYQYGNVAPRVYPPTERKKKR